jgi:hypothetical protein
MIILDTNIVSEPLKILPTPRLPPLNGFILATRNERDFNGTGVELLNPWVMG